MTAAMTTDFRKMHGAGNDFVIVDARAGALPLSPARIAALADRRTGIGCDQFITLEPSGLADVFMRIHNPDGSEAGACGNATRCVAALLHAESGRAALAIETISGVLPARIGAGEITVDMGVARFGWRDIPLAREADTLVLPVEGGPAACSLGNPHATLFVDDIAAAPVASLGARLEHDPLFPERANIGFAQVLSPDRLRLRVWERGAGLTLACGSGACAALVNAARRGLTARRAELVLDGGTLVIEWRDDNHVLMTGPFAFAFEGVVDLEAYPP
jgi:diaminopimelate epimerase